MQARYYDPVIGRFYSNDPVGFRGTHSFNRYAYANNNPYKYTDPDGRCPDACIIEAGVATGTVAVYAAASVGVALGCIEFCGKIKTGIENFVNSVFNESSESDFGAAGNLPDLTGETPQGAAEILGENGFEDKGKTEGGNSKYYHPDGSRVHIDKDGNVKVTGKKQDKQDGSGKYRPRLDKDRNKLEHGDGLDNHDTGEKLDQ